MQHHSSSALRVGEIATMGIEDTALVLKRLPVICCQQLETRIALFLSSMCGAFAMWQVLWWAQVIQWRTETDMELTFLGTDSKRENINF